MLITCIVNMQLEFLSNCRGSGTSVVSFHIPASANIMPYRAQVAAELATAQNIKDKTNRHSVIAALKAIQEQLARVSEVPSTGLAVFAGECL